MSQTINSFLVGVGYDYDDKGEKDIVSGLDGIKSKALIVGSVIAGAFGAAAIASNFAETRDELGKFSDVFGVTANNVHGLGLALEQEGGSLNSFMSQIEGIERIRAAALKGDYSVFEAAGISGADASVIMNAKDATEAYIALADQFQGMSGKQRLNAADAFGLDEASIRLLSKGSSGVRSLMGQYQRIRPVTKEMTDTSAEYNDQIMIMQQNIAGLSDKLSMALLPSMTDTVGGMNEWIEANRELINQNVDLALEKISGGFGDVAAAGTLLTTGGLLAGLASMSKSIPLIGSGLAAIAGAAGTLSLLGAAGVGGYAAGDRIYENMDSDTKHVIGGTIAQILANFGVESAQAAIDQEMKFKASQQSRQPVQVNLMLDGKVIDKRIIDYTETENEKALEELASPSAG